MIIRIGNCSDTHAVTLCLFLIVVEGEDFVAVAEDGVGFGVCLCRIEEFLYFMGDLKDFLGEVFCLVTVRHLSTMSVYHLTFFYSPLQLVFEIFTYIGVVLGTVEHVGAIINSLQQLFPRRIVVNQDLIIRSSLHLWHLGYGLDDDVFRDGDGFRIGCACVLIDLHVVCEIIGLIIICELGHRVVDNGPLSLTGHHQIIALKIELRGIELICSHLCLHLYR